MWQGNKFLTTRFQAAAASEGKATSFVSGLCDYHYLTPNVAAIPFRLRKKADAVPNGGLFKEDHLSAPGYIETANLSAKARQYLHALGIANPDGDRNTSDLLWYHVLAISYSPAYLSEHADGIRADFPRVPLPATREALEASAALGKQIAGLLDTETPVPGVTITPFYDSLRSVAILTHSDRPGLEDGDLAVTAGWGSATKTGVMPGRGKSEEKPDGTLDIYLNEKVAWRGVPMEVWQYTVGGYQVIKKWLSYREKNVLGRDLSTEEAREVQLMARRLITLITLNSSLDINYANVCSMIYNW